MKKLVSIIVPVYNIENYIERCLNSLINQTYENTEIIVIDDGSSDNSKNIVDTYKNIKVIHTDNKGLSAARNLGIKNANGEYIMFVDGDDYVSTNYVSHMVKSIDDKDVAICAFKDKDIDITFKERKSSGKELLMNAMSRDGYKYIIMMNKIYRKSLFDKLMFKEGVNYEDEFINYHLFYDIDEVVYTNEILYFYEYRKDSITNSIINKEKLDTQKMMHLDRINFYKDRDIRLYKRAVQMYLNWMVNTGINIDFKKYWYIPFNSKDVRMLEKLSNIIGLINIKLSLKLKNKYKENETH